MRSASRNSAQFLSRQMRRSKSSPFGTEISTAESGVSGLAGITRWVLVNLLVSQCRVATVGRKSAKSHGLSVAD